MQFSRISKKGAIMIMVVYVIFILVILGLVFSLSIRRELRVVDNMKNYYIGYYFAESGLVLGEELIKNKNISYNEILKKIIKSDIKVDIEEINGEKVIISECKLSDYKVKLYKYLNGKYFLKNSGE